MIATGHWSLPPTGQSRQDLPQPKLHIAAYLVVGKLLCRANLIGFADSETCVNLEEWYNNNNRFTEHSISVEVKRNKHAASSALKLSCCSARSISAKYPEQTILLPRPEAWQLPNTQL